MSFLAEMAEAYGHPYRSEFRAILDELRPAATRFLEWGSGVTTGILCDVARTRNNPFVLSIDHNASYQRKVAAELPKYPFLHLRTLDLQGPSFSQADLAPSYSSYPLYIGATFDVAFIDGRRRMECALTAAQCLSDDGIVILHDWRRSRYQGVHAMFDVVKEGDEFLVLRPKSPLRRERPQRNGNERFAVVVPVRGPRAERELQITRPFFERYAQSIGADFVTVGAQSTVPPHRLKACALDVADTYERMIVADCDILIRDKTPSLFDIIPQTHIGVMFEGQIFPREQACAELNVVYEQSAPLSAQEYFNSGLMVLSRDHYRLLRALWDETVFGSPQFEQGFLNVRRASMGMPAFPLTIDMNYIPDAEFLSTDWRFGFIVHFAGSGKVQYNFSHIWQDASGDGKTFSFRKGLAADVRDTLLRCAAREMAGETVYMSDPTDFTYVNHRAFCYCSLQGQAVGHVKPSENPLLAVYGAKRPVPRGSYRASLVTPEEVPLTVNDAKFDICLDGTHVIADGVWPPDGIICFELADDSPCVEVRLYSASSEFEFVRLEIVPSL